MGHKIPWPTEEEIMLMTKATGMDRQRAIQAIAIRDGVTCGEPIGEDGTCPHCGRSSDEHNYYE
jgi:hypothetical protein